MPVPELPFPTRLTGMDELLKRVARYTSFGKELEVTEFDINSTDEATQTDYTRDFMTAMFAEPQVKLRRDWSLKPNGQVKSSEVRVFPRKAIIVSTAIRDASSPAW